ncbi:helix-turn-helix domain-containing protein [Bifidobacterium vespertilionis]|uniref:Uncharacterized protein n=1 Tax=Bifidobacterium vespertilionis TaxID=2562524 RepID=A0A5J5DW40_9BIFI|nr:hypothetical protein [Bifidobacterium vespertilionis]KAA8820765.1 hypothetical protein EMO90_06175 [Bifidobacterium vespertilionis]KAA8821054.1 hypothetical protein EM848_11440 [Bifidobacterium vespertilionis]
MPSAREMLPAKCRPRNAATNGHFAKVSEVIWNYLKISKCIYLYCHLMLCARWIRVCPDGPVRTADVAKRFRSKGAASSARTSLIEEGLIYPAGYGQVAFSVPRMGEFARRALPAVEQPYDGRR